MTTEQELRCVLSDLCYQAREREDEIERLESELDAERQRRFDGNRIASEEHRAELAHVKEVEFPRKAKAVSDGWRNKLAAAQAVIEQMREALQYAVEQVLALGTVPGVAAAITLPTDDTALQQRLAQERERVSQMVRAGKVKQTRDEGTVVVDWDSSEEAADAILTMGSPKPGDAT